MVLFVCVHNAGRSQMASALLEELSGGSVDVRSAGTQPAEEIHPRVVEAMSERGFDLSSRLPRRLDVEAIREANVVVTMGCGDACPVYPGKRYEDWDVPDPAGRSLDEVRAIRDHLEDRVRSLIETLE